MASHAFKLRECLVKAHKLSDATIAIHSSGLQCSVKEEIDQSGHQHLGELDSLKMWLLLFMSLQLILHCFIKYFIFISQYLFL